MKKIALLFCAVMLFSAIVPLFVFSQTDNTDIPNSALKIKGDVKKQIIVYKLFAKAKSYFMKRPLPKGMLTSGCIRYHIKLSMILYSMLDDKGYIKSVGHVSEPQNLGKLGSGNPCGTFDVPIVLNLNRT